MLEMIEINVEARHIRNGKPKSKRSCPVALALSEAWPDAAEIWVRRRVIEVEDSDGVWYDCLMSPELRNWVSDFDDTWNCNVEDGVYTGGMDPDVFKAEFGRMEED